MIGREREIDAVGGLLLREDVRLLTLSGPGGIGKTRLALEAGDRVAEHFDGVRFVGLAQTSDPEAVAETLASDLGLRSSGARSALEELQAHLGSRRMLLLLDNFEQVADAAPVVAELLAAAPGVTALITSRTVLRVSGEHHYAVPALPLPATRFVVDARSAEAFDGIELFVRRVQAGTPAFRLTDANAATVAEICRRLDGLPLAIELAAARVALMTPEALLERLGNRLDLLTSGPRDAPGRHRTLRDTIAWSYELLEPAERELLERLGSFAGSFDVDGAEAIDGRGAATVELLGALVDDSLVQREASRFGVRFALLATIRDFARERARESGREIAAAERHARYHLAVAERAEPLLRGPSQAEWLDRLSADHENLRAAMSWFLGADDVESAVRLGWAVWMYWWLTGHVDDAARWADAMVERSDGVDRHLQARALQGAAFQLLNAGDFAAARELLERSRRDFVHVADRPGVARSGTALGFLAVLRGDLDQAEALLDESIGHFRDLGDDWFLAVTLGYRGLVPLARGELDGAAGVFREALAVSRVVGDTLPLLISSCNLAVSEARRGALATAGRHYADALAVAAAAGDAGSVGFVLRGLASLAAANDEREHAVLVSAAADALCESAGGAWLETHAAPRLIGDAEDATLDVAVLTEAQERGRQLSMDQAVEVALAGAARRDPA